jgi:cytochrome P450
MNNQPQPDWNPTSPEVLRDQRAAYDKMRSRCPVAYSELMGWSLFQHEDVTRALHDPEAFSNAVSQHLSVPNGMDPPEHTVYRQMIEPYFCAKRMEAFEPLCRRIAGDLVRALAALNEVEFMEAGALPFAVRVQCAFLGWPPGLQQSLVLWTRKNHQATLAQDRKAISEIALEFERIIDELLETRLQANAGPEVDLTAALMHEKVWGRTLSNEEVASVLRNWTVGEIGTISAAVGILAHYLTEHAELQKQLRSRPALLPRAIDEILRIHGPLLTNRRITTRPVEMGGKKIEAGERVTLMWTAANRDERAFDEPDSFRLDRGPAKNLLYGAGIHICPGAPLASLELRVFMEEFLSRTADIVGVPERRPVLAVYPASGFARLHLRLHAPAVTE